MGDGGDDAGRLAALEARIEALEARVSELDDDRAIRDLLARYGYTADNGNDEAFVELYTDDGVIIAANDREADGGNGGWRGKDGVRAFITNPNGHHRPELLGKSMHLHGNNLVTYLDGDEAVADSYGVALIVDDDGTRVLAAHNNEWRFRRVNDQWRIAERRSAALGDEWFATNLEATPD